MVRRRQDSWMVAGWLDGGKIVRRWQNGWTLAGWLDGGRMVRQRQDGWMVACLYRVRLRLELVAHSTIIRDLNQLQVIYATVQYNSQSRRGSIYLFKFCIRKRLQNCYAKLGSTET
jgi:hypothetical protein